MKKFLIIGLLLSCALGVTVDIQPNFIRALPGESFDVTVVILADSVGFYSVRVEGAGINLVKNYELLPGQSFQIPLSAKAPVKSGRSSITAIVSVEEETVSASATVEVVEESQDSVLINQTLHETRWELDDLIGRSQGMDEASSLLTQAETLVNKANSSYQSGYLISAKSDLDEARIKMQQATTLIELAEEGSLNINISLLIIGLMIILIAFVLMNYLK